MHLALEAIGLQCGNEVITTPYNFAASAELIWKVRIAQLSKFIAETLIFNRM
jgi:dTDP-4-amino-4,6-dideoxygalactose transaminase